MIGNISLDDDTPEEKVSLDTTSEALPPNSSVASQRAIKADYGLGEKSPGAPTLYSGIATGIEPSIRRSGAIDEGIEFAQRRNKLVADIAAQHGADLTPEQVAVLYDMSKADFTTNPDDVFERKFSERFHTDALQVNAQNSQSPIQQGLKEDPDEVLRLTDMSQHPTMIREYAKTLGEDLQNQWNHTGWVSAGAQYAGQFLPLMSAWNLHNVLQGPNTAAGVLPGENLGQGIDHLLRLPYADAQKLLKQAVEQVNKTSTLDAMTLVQAVQKYTSLESTVNNLVGITDVAGIASTAGKGLLKVAKGAGNLADRVSLARAARQRATSAATVEDSAEAAVQEMSKEVGVVPAQPPKTFYIPKDVAENLESVSIPEGGITEFKTSKGSTYTYDGATTTRNRVAHEGDTPKTSTGPQPQSEKTYFVSADDLDAVIVQKGRPQRVLEMKDGKIGISYQQENGQWSKPYGSNVLSTSPSPKEGLAPIEVWGKYPKNPYKTDIYGQVHYGNKITEVTRGDSAPVFWTNQAENEGFTGGKRAEGMVPVTIDANHTIKFGRPETGETYYLPASAIKRMKAVTKFGRAPEFKASMDKNGQPTIWLDRKTKEFVQPTKEAADGLMPVSISKDGKVEFLMSGPMKDTQKALADTTKALAETELKPAEVMSQIGDHDKASTIKAVKMATEPKAADFIESLPSGMNPRNFFGKGSSLSNNFAARMMNKFATDTQKIWDVLGKLDVARLTPEATAVGVREAQDQLKRIYGGRVNDGWLDWLHIPPELNPNKANLDTIIGRFGDLNARPFESRKAAELYLREIYKFAPGEAHVAQQGSSFYIQVQRFLDETSEGVRQANITPKNSTPVSMVNMLLNRVRTSEDLLADFQRGNRHVATHAPQVLNKLLREQIDDTARSLTKQQRRNVEEILRVNRDELNPALGPNKRGNFYRTDADFEVAYQTRFGRLPTDKETAHYFNYTRVSDIDYTIRNLAMYRDKGRLGVEQFNFSYINSKGTKDKVPYFEGKELDHFPWGGQNAGVLIHDVDGETRFLYKHGVDRTIDQSARKTIDDLIKDRAFKVVQVFNPTKRPFADVDFVHGKVGEQVHFVVTNASDRKALDFQQLDYRPGGHSIYMDDWYVKQPQLMVGQAGRLHYYGDNAVMNFATEAEAKKYAERLDIARVMLKNNDARLDSFLAANVPYHIDDFKKMFSKGHLDLDTPIVHARSGTSTFDTVTSLKPEYREMVDATKSEYNLAGSIDSSYTADRNLVLDTVQERGGFMAIAPGRQLDPYEAMNKGLGQAVRNLWMNDYKIQAVQQWIEEFGDVMKPRFKELSNNPMFFLYNPQWNEAVVDKARLAAAKASQRAIVNFVGANSELGGQITFLQNKMMDWVYGKAGQGGAQFFGDHLLPAIKDPASYVRAVAFHSKLGLFNPIQLFVQMQSMANVLAIAGPTHGVPGASAAFLMRRMAHTVDPNILDHFGGMAANLGWRKADFLEMYDVFRKTGLYEVAGEAALRDDVFDPKLFRSTVGAFLDKGTFFFNEGERAVRMTAFATAYREWKVANPARVIGNRETAEIMNRSDTLSASMTRASAASWQNGIMSIPTQFVTYNARIAEQFFSKRLTATEKAKMFGIYSALYGVPTSLGAAAGIWPFYDDIKEAAMKRGIDLSPAYMKGMMEGIPSMIFSSVTGHDYNFSQRYGPGGSTMVRDLVRGDKSFMETMGGPSASIIGDIFASVEPALHSLGSLMTGNSETFPTRREDWLGIVNNSSTASLATRIYTALAYHQYVSKNNVTVGPMDNMDAVMSILGVTPMQITDTYIMSKAGKEDQEVKKVWEESALKQFGLALSSLDRNDQQGFADYMSRFNTYMSSDLFTPEDRTRIEARASQYKKSLDEKVREDFWRKAPANQRDQRFDRLQSFFTNQRTAP